MKKNLAYTLSYSCWVLFIWLVYQSNQAIAKESCDDHLRICWHEEDRGITVIRHIDYSHFEGLSPDVWVLELLEPRRRSAIYTSVRPIFDCTWDVGSNTWLACMSNGVFQFTRSSERERKDQLIGLPCRVPNDVLYVRVASSPTSIAAIGVVLDEVKPGIMFYDLQSHRVTNRGEFARLALGQSPVWLDLDQFFFATLDGVILVKPNEAGSIQIVGEWNIPDRDGLHGHLDNQPLISTKSGSVWLGSTLIIQGLINPLDIAIVNGSIAVLLDTGGVSLYQADGELIDSWDLPDRDGSDAMRILGQSIIREYADGQFEMISLIDSGNASFFATSTFSP